MIRNLRMLGLAIAAMLVLGAMASAASAAEFHSEASSTTTTAEQPTGFNDKMTTDLATLECNTATYAGSVTGTTNTTVSMTPSYSECITSFGASVIIDINGCEYVFSGATSTLGVSCPPGKRIESTTPGCVTTVPAQTGLKVTTFKNEGSGSTRHITVHMEVTGIAYEEHNKGFFPNCKNNTVSKNNGTYTGTATVKGFFGGNQVGIWYE